MAATLRCTGAAFLGGGPPTWCEPSEALFSALHREMAWAQLDRVPVSPLAPCAVRCTRVGCVHGLSPAPPCVGMEAPCDMGTAWVLPGAVVEFFLGAFARAPGGAVPSGGPGAV
jgi:hypothetical protein